MYVHKQIITSPQINAIITSDTHALLFTSTIKCRGYGKTKKKEEKEHSTTTGDISLVVRAFYEHVIQFNSQDAYMYI